MYLLAFHSSGLLPSMSASGCSARGRADTSAASKVPLAAAAAAASRDARGAVPCACRAASSRKTRTAAKQPRKLSTPLRAQTQYAVTAKMTWTTKRRHIYIIGCGEKVSEATRKTYVVGREDVTAGPEREGAHGLGPKDHGAEQGAEDRRSRGLQGFLWRAREKRTHERCQAGPSLRGEFLLEEEGVGHGRGWRTRPGHRRLLLCRDSCRRRLLLLLLFAVPHDAVLEVVDLHVAVVRPAALHQQRVGQHRGEVGPRGVARHVLAAGREQGGEDGPGVRPGPLRVHGKVRIQNCVGC